MTTDDYDHNVGSSSGSARPGSFHRRLLIETLNQALRLAEAMVEKKAIDPVLLEVTDFVSYGDYLLIATGTSRPHVEALVEACTAEAAAQGMTVLNSEGRETCRWVLVDYGEVLLHVFQTNERGYYDLEGMWLDAKRIEIPGAEASSYPAGFVAS